MKYISKNEKGETPEEKAKRLGVPLVPLRKPDLERGVENLVKMRKGYHPPTIAVCGGCSIEIKLGAVKSPCGRTFCPYGILIH